MSNKQNELYLFGDFRLDVGEHKLERLDGTSTASLPEKAFQTLVHLVRNAGTLLGKEELLSAVWPDTIVEENNLGKAVYTLRQYLGEKRGEARYIETVPKHGYRFVAEVRKGGEDAELYRTGAPGEPSASGDDSPQVSRAAYRRVGAAAAIICLALLAWLAVTWLPRASQQDDRQAAGETSARRLDRSPAYDLYVRGKVKVAGENAEDTEAAIKLLEEAVRLDPELAEGYAQLARGYNTMAFKYSSGDDAKQFHENAEVAIEKALDLNPNLAEAHFARGLILWTESEGFPHEKAIQAYKRSLELDPTLDETYHQLSLVYSHIGLLDEAQKNVNRALEINPNNTLARFRVGVYASYQGRFDEAIAVYKTIPRDFTPLLVDRSIAEALAQIGHLAEAEKIVDAYLQRFPEDEGGSFTGLKALILAKEGKQQEAEAAIERAKTGRGYGHFHHTAYNIASAYAVMNKPAEALEWLQNTADDGFPNYTYFAIDHNLDNLRTYDRFSVFMKKLMAQMERYREMT